MLITNHVFIGAAIGALVRRPLPALALGVASHFAADSLPHWGNKSDFLRVAVRDGLSGLAVMSAITALTPRPHRSSVFLGMLGSCLPDANKPSKLFFGFSPFPHSVDRFHSRLQRESPARMPQEVALMLLGAVATAAVLIPARRRLKRSERGTLAIASKPTASTVHPVHTNTSPGDHPNGV